MGDQSIEELREIYLDLLETTLTIPSSRDALAPVEFSKERRTARIRALAATVRLVAPRFTLCEPLDVEAIREGRLTETPRETMIGIRRMRNLRDCVVTAIEGGVAGDLIETGVWRGGASIYMRGILKAYGEDERLVWLADSFEGLPRPNPAKYPADAGDAHWRVPELPVGQDEVRANFERFGLLDEQVRFLPGWFSETLPDAPIDELAVIRLDGDMYESTIVALESLYPKLSVGGFVIVDDYGAVPGCRKAVLDYRSRFSIDDRLESIDWTGRFWRKTR